MNENIKKLNLENFNDCIAEDIPVLVDFYADWCGPCKMLSPIIDEVANEVVGKAIVAKINTDECYDICVKYRITSIPTLMLFKNGELKEKSVGLVSRMSAWPAECRWA